MVESDGLSEMLL